jgi:hypothetical protein
MAEALRFHTVVSGNTLTNSDLGRFKGRRVEVIVLDDESHGAAGGDVGPKPKRRFGTMAGQIKVEADFDAPLPAEIERAFQGDDD